MSPTVITQILRYTNSVSIVEKIDHHLAPTKNLVYLYSKINILFQEVCEWRILVSVKLVEAEDVD